MLALVSTWNLGDVVAAIAIVIGVWKFLASRKRELAWKRTEFIFEQAAYIDTDEDIAAAISIAQSALEDVTIDEVFDENGEWGKSSSTTYRQGFEKLLNLLDRLAYAHLHAHTISVSEIANFHWYYELITDHERIKKHCQINGFKDAAQVAEKLKADQKVNTTKNKLFRFTRLSR